LALVIFVLGLFLSFMSIDAEDVTLRSVPLLVNFIVGAPLAIAMNAVSLQMAGRVVGQAVGFRSAFHTCATATAANVLPIPVGAFLQSAVLVGHGATIFSSGLVIILGNIVLLTLVSILLGFNLISVYPSAGWSLVATGFIGLMVCIVFLCRFHDWKLASAFLGTRIARILLMVVRLKLSFFAIGLDVSLLDASAFTGAVVLGATVAVVPAGLGVSESLAALTALAISIGPAIAFIAVALNRVSTLVIAALLAGLLFVFSPADEK